MIPLPLLAIISSILLLFQVGLHPEQSELPSWTSKEPEISANGEIFTVQTEDFSNHRDAMMAILPAARTAIFEWAIEKFGTDEIGISLTDEMIEERFVHKERILIRTFREDHGPEKAAKLGQEFDLFYRGYVQIRIPLEFSENLTETLERDVLSSRLIATLASGIFCFGSLGILWCYLRAMQLTRGLYRSRLRWISVTIFLGLILACYAVSRLG